MVDLRTVPGRAALWLLCGACVLTPLLVGGVLPAWTPALAGGVALCLALLACQRVPGGRRMAPAWFLLLCAVPAGVAALQLVPLPVSLVRVLSPHAAELRGFVAPAAAWLPLSLDVPATVYELCRSVTLLGVGLAVFCRCHERRDSRLILRGLVIVGVVEAAVAGIHYFQGNTKSILFLYALPTGWESGLGTFVNRNHAAGLLVLTSCVTAGLALEAGRSRPLYLMALGGQLLALLLSHSRGGLAAATLAAALLLGTVFGRRTGEGRALIGGAALSGLGTAAGVLCMPGFARRVQQLWDGNIWHYEKVRVWRDALPMARDYLALGAGRGSFLSVFASYRSGDEYVQVPYPACLPLQHLTELGLVATVLLWAIGAWLVRDLWSRRRVLHGPELAAAAGVAGVVAQNLVEFSLELPGVSVPVVACLGLLVARAHRHRGREEAAASVPRLLLPVCALVLVACGAACWARTRLLIMDKAQVRGAVLRHDLTRAEQLFSAAQARHPADFNIALLGASIALLSGSPQVTLHRVNRVLQLHPADEQAHRLAAWALQRVRHQGQAVLELRLAFEHGWVMEDATLQEAAALVGYPALLDAVPQERDVMRFVERHLLARHLPEVAARARYRALVLDPDRPDQPPG